MFPRAKIAKFFESPKPTDFEKCLMQFKYFVEQYLIDKEKSADGYHIIFTLPVKFADILMDMSEFIPKWAYRIYLLDSPIDIPKDVFFSPRYEWGAWNNIRFMLQGRKIHMKIVYKNVQSYIGKRMVFPVK